MHALSVKQPHAERIANGTKRIEYRTWRAPSIVGSDLLIVASKTPDDDYDGEPLGVAICVVRVVKMTGEPGEWCWHLSAPRRVQPFPVRGYAALYRVSTPLLFVTLTPSTRKAHAPSGATIAAPTGPYSFSIGDRGLRGQRAKTPAAARALARELAAVHGTTITISRDGIAIGGEG